MTTNLKYPRVDFFDPRTGGISREWNMFLLGLFNRTGAEDGVSSQDLEDVLDYVSSSLRSVVPSSVPQNIEELARQMATSRNSREDQILKRVEVLEMRLEALEKKDGSDAVLAAVRETQQFIYTG